MEENSKTHSPMPLGLRILSYILVAVMSATVTLVTYVRVTRIRPTEGTEKLAQLQELIEEKYIGTYDETQLIDSAAAGMVAGTGDRWSYYISAQEMERHQQQKDNRYVGIGVTVMNNEDGMGLDVISVEPEGPAQKAGILPGDILYTADGQLLSEVGLSGSSQVIGGQEGTYVTVGVKRPTEDGGFEDLEYRIMRSSVKVAVATGQLLEDNIGYIKIANFNSGCAEETIRCINTLRLQGAQALVFDVRFNGGGYKHELVELLDYLLPEGDLFVSVDYTGAEEVDTSDADCLEMPMAVLVNESSYSAAEFFAAALEEYDWAILGGAPTTGKGYFQSTYTLSDGSAVALSVGKYYTPERVSLAEVGGLVPEYAVEVDDEAYAMLYSGLLEPREDAQLQAVTEALLEQMQ